MAVLPKYAPIAHNAEKDEQFRIPARKLATWRYTMLAALGLGLVSWVSFTLGRLSITNTQCGKKLSTWSPALGVVEYHQTTFDGDFLAPSPWRGVPTKELDEAWYNITNAGMRNMRIKTSDLASLNKTKNDRTEFIYADGQEGTAVASLEVFHHLHCLNDLRKRTWPSYYPETDDPKTLKVHRAHLDHCIEMLRISIMCHADVTPVTLYIPEFQDDPLPDFSTLHNCRDFDKILDYVQGNTMDYYLPDLQ